MINKLKQWFTPTPQPPEVPYELTPAEREALNSIVEAHAYLQILRTEAIDKYTPHGLALPGCKVAGDRYEAFKNAFNERMGTQ